MNSTSTRSLQEENFNRQQRTKHINNTTDPQNFNDQSRVKNLINISTINVRGAGDRAKIYSLCQNLRNKRSILCSTESKQSKVYPLSKKTLNNIIISSEPSVNAKNGTFIIVGEDLGHHIFETKAVNEYWCAIHLKFRPRVNIIITCLYLPHDKKERKIALNSFKDHIKSYKNNAHHIVAGDFNSYPYNSPAINAPTTYLKRKIYTFLRNWIDCTEVTNSTDKYTHVTQTSSSRIDQIWITAGLASKILEYRVLECNSIIMDYKEVHIVLDWFEYKNRK